MESLDHPGVFIPKPNLAFELPYHFIHSVFFWQERTKCLKVHVNSFACCLNPAVWHYSCFYEARGWYQKDIPQHCIIPTLICFLITQKSYNISFIDAKALENVVSGCFLSKGYGRECTFKSTSNSSILYDPPLGGGYE